MNQPLIKIPYGLAAGLLLLAACGSETDNTIPISTSGASTSGTGGSSASSSQSSSASSTATASTTGMVASSSSSGMGGGSAMNCDPPAAAGSFYELAANIFPLGPEKSMCDYRGEVVLIVNTAAL